MLRRTKRVLFQEQYRTGIPTFRTFMHRCTMDSGTGKSDSYKDIVTPYVEVEAIMKTRSQFRVVFFPSRLNGTEQVTSSL